MKNIVVSNHLNISVPIFQITEVLTKRFAYVRENDNRHRDVSVLTCVFQTSPCRHGETAAEVLPDKSWDLWGRFLRNGFQPDSCKKKGKLILERPFVRWCASLREFREVLRFEVLKTFVWCMFFCHQVSTLHLRLPGIQTDGIETCDTPLVGQESEILNLQGVGLGFHKMKAKKKAGQSKYIESSQPGMVSHRMGGWCSSSTLCSP